MDTARLTPGQELELVIGADAGDVDACRGLTDAFLPAIVALAGRFPVAFGVDRSELVQEGVAGLLFAARRFDPALNAPFWAYASFWVRKAMQELVAEMTRPVALSDRAVRGLAEIRRARRLHVQTHGADPTTEELSGSTGFTAAQLESLQATERTPRSMDEHKAVDGDTSATIADSLIDPGAERDFERVLDRIEIEEVRRLTDRLDERERAVIGAHFGLGQPAQTLNQIGGKLGLTAERARQIEVAALRKMRDALARPAPADGALT